MTLCYTIYLDHKTHNILKNTARRQARSFQQDSQDSQCNLLQTLFCIFLRHNCHMECRCHLSIHLDYKKKEQLFRPLLPCTLATHTTAM